MSKPDFAGTWNAKADAHNTWIDLSEDERLAWAYAAGLESAAEIADREYDGTIRAEDDPFYDGFCVASKAIATAIRREKETK